MSPLVKFTQTRKWLSMLFPSVQANPEITFYYSVSAMNCNDTAQHPIRAQRDKYIRVFQLRSEVHFWAEFSIVLWFISWSNLGVQTWFLSDQSSLELFPCAPAASSQPRSMRPARWPPKAISHPQNLWLPQHCFTLQICSCCRVFLTDVDSLGSYSLWRLFMVINTYTIEIVMLSL